MQHQQFNIFEEMRCVSLKTTKNFDCESSKWLCQGSKRCLWLICLTGPIFVAKLRKTGDEYHVVACCVGVKIVKNLLFRMS